MKDGKKLDGKKLSSSSARVSVVGDGIGDFEVEDSPSTEEMGKDGFQMIPEVASMLERAGGTVVVLTGAGISEESGIPTFRDGGGLWEKYNQMAVSSIKGFVEDPARAWAFEEDFYKLTHNVEPNAAHYALAEMQKLGLIERV